jgi:hypothetical protein
MEFQDSQKIKKINNKRGKYRKKLPHSDIKIFKLINDNISLSNLSLSKLVR